MAKAVEGLKKEIGTFRIGVALPKNLRVTKNVERGREKEREREREREKNLNNFWVLHLGR